jgi:glutamate--cysteine ligase
MSDSPTPPAASDAPRLTRDRLVEIFSTYGRPRDTWLIGGEFERAVVRGDGSPVRYDDPDGIRWILEQLQARQPGWSPVIEEGHLIALLRPDGSSITLEPGGQVELSGAPHETLTALADEMRDNRNMLLELAEGRDLHWIACGVTPVASVDAVSWMPKGRYAIMRDYLPKKGDLALNMMKTTTSVQCNYDFLDEADCAQKVRLCAGLSSLITAMFSNSPLVENRPSGFKSYRGHIWTRTDPDRCGFPPGLRDAYSHARWVDYLLDVPMMFHKVRGRWVPVGDLTFRQFLERGFDGTWPTLDDWDRHMTAVFPEVRIKRTIEVRGADCVGHELALAFCAFFTGLLYCNAATDEALQLVAELEGHGTHRSRFDTACRDGLEGSIGGRSVADWARDLADIGHRGLTRCLPPDAPLLEPLLSLVEDGVSPADLLLAAWERDPSPAAVLRAVAY